MRTHQIFLAFFIPFWLINLSINIDAARNHYCFGHQQLLLLQLKNSLIFNPATSKKLVHWNKTDDDCCQWNGVTCNKGQVVGLDLSDELISGGLHNSSSLFNLQYLQNLNLAHNEFGSSIPSTFGKLKNLRHLNLSNAGFVGQIPAEISQLTKLVALDLSSSFSTQHTLKLVKPNIAMLVQNLTEVRELFLDGVKISDEGKEWSQALSSLRKLRVLSMSYCNLTGSIDSSISMLEALEVIRLNLNNISGLVPESFSSFSNLKVLELRDSRLSGYFPNGIFQIQSLNVLDVSTNHDLHGYLPKFLQNLSLHTLKLDNTKFSGQIPDSISNLKHLSTLNLSSCQFNGTLPTSMSKLTQIVELDLSFNEFSGPIPSLNISKNLRYFSVLHNNLTGSIKSSHFEGLLHLLNINLGDNSLFGKVPSSLFTLPSLQELTLSNNGFQGPLDEFSNASSFQLHLVDLSHNRLEGQIPLSFFQLKGLQFLQLSENEFNGSIHLDVLHNLPSLHTLGLSNNNLSVYIPPFNDDHSLSSFPIMKYLLLASCKLGEFPGFLRNQSQLHALDLSNNQIHGPIPNWIWRFESLVYLNLSKNFLTSLEGPLENLNSNLYILDLHSNQLPGSIPTFTKYAVHLDYSSNRFSYVPSTLDKYIPSLFYFSLSNNSLRGNIDDSFCKFSSLRLLDLSYNSFKGSIPKCLTRKNSTLRVLNLAKNKLIGYVSDRISSSCNLRFLDLNSNTLVGPIPKSLSNCQKLQVLNLGNNHFSNEFPCFLGNIATLRVLILRSNRLHGPVKCQHSNRNWEMLHIVDLASNNFSGMVSGSLLQRWSRMMGDDNEAHQKFGNLFFDMFDNHDTIRFKDLFTVIDKDLVIKLNKLLGGEPYSVIDHIFAYYVTANELGGRYLDSVTIVGKNLHLNYIKIPSIFTALDLSSNHLEGPIPEELVNLRALHVLNLSHNAFSGHIPSSIGNLMNLESMDLSYNNLSGRIPTEISSLYFLSVLNLSFNHLVGEIPTGSQIQTFDAYSFEGNDGLCGLPLTKNCGDNGMKEPLSPSSEKKTSINWSFLSVELGFTFGFGLIILPLIFWKRWRLWYCKNMDDLLHKIFPQLEFVYEQQGEQRYRNLRWNRS
ncbi:hypothetical protein HN51_005299 [Arachis hypogaea]|uniref:Uncharacterized protein n=2 Tax=Arachis TaxID=3817 RepID=A0A445DFB9_ARAHY|nr:receptor-like protein 6 [Arachis duranensis]XP_025692841.1 receptor-like protein 6 [Arachis hypogaea]QHO39047.1 Receptor-like protein [Arachis hypogaea]RYR61822.1 hypothetical protein Ahy_A04g019046 isoform C [Arachis hypogaea]